MLRVFFFNDTATTEIYTLSLHDALPIFLLGLGEEGRDRRLLEAVGLQLLDGGQPLVLVHRVARDQEREDRKSTRLNSSHATISYAVFCLKKKTRKSTLSYVILSFSRLIS